MTERDRLELAQTDGADLLVCASWALQAWENAAEIEVKKETKAEAVRRVESKAILPTDALGDQRRSFHYSFEAMPLAERADHHPLSKEQESKM